MELPCTDDDDVEELHKMCVARYVGRDVTMTNEDSKRWMWYEIMKEFSCKVTSIWSSCDCESEMAFTHRHSGKDGKGRTTQLDYIIGPRGQRMRPTFTTTFRLGTHGTSIRKNASIHEADVQHYFPRRRKKKKWAGWRPVNGEAKDVEFKKDSDD